jgi:DNA polymerase
MTGVRSECKWFSVCPLKQGYEKGVVEEHWILRFCKGNWQHCVRYQMEERGEYHPDWMLPDGTLNKELEEFFEGNK